MSCGITNSRSEPCKDILGGIKNVYLWKWANVPFWQIQGVKGVDLTSYPTTNVFKFETIADANDYNEGLQEDNAYEQTLNVTLKREDLDTNIHLARYQNIVLGVIVEDYNGFFRLMGAYNGCEIESINLTTGGGKADFNGYQLEIKASERFKAPLFTDLEGVGFIIDSETFYLLDDNTGAILTDENTNRLIYA
jgi:hypothetical protein